MVEGPSTISSVPPWIFCEASEFRSHWIRSCRPGPEPAGADSWVCGEETASSSWRRNTRRRRPPRLPTTESRARHGNGLVPGGVRKAGGTNSSGWISTVSLNVEGSLTSDGSSTCSRGSSNSSGGGVGIKSVSNRAVVRGGGGGAGSATGSTGGRAVSAAGRGGISASGSALASGIRGAGLAAGCIGGGGGAGSATASTGGRAVSAAGRGGISASGFRPSRREFAGAQD